MPRVTVWNEHPRRGRGRVVHVRPGDERYPTCHPDDVGRLLWNAARWAGWESTRAEAP